VCTPDDVALSVLCTVIGHQHDKGWAPGRRRLDGDEP
jgi:D-serine deaminase-like pyridoxal phosphate-dependent protein